MKNIYYVLVLAMLNFCLSAADITAKRLRIEEQQEAIATKVEVQNLNDLCLENLYVHFLPKIIEKFDVQLTLETEFATLHLPEQIKIIQGLCYDFANVHITLDQLSIGLSGYSSQSPVVYPFFKKMIRGLIAKNAPFRQWINSYKTVLLQSTSENIDENLKLFATVPFSVQEYIQQELLFAQSLETCSSQESPDCVLSDSDEKYVVLKDSNPHDPQVIILDHDLNFIVHLPCNNLDDYYIVDDKYYSVYHFPDRICAYDLIEKKYIADLEHGTDAIYYTYLADNNLLFAVTKSADTRSTILCWDLNTHTLIHNIRDLEQKIYALTYKNNHVYALTNNGEILCIDLATKQVTKIVSIAQQHIAELKRGNMKCNIFVHNNLLYAQIGITQFTTTVFIWELPTEQLPSGRLIGGIENNYTIKRKNHLLYILSTDRFRVWDMNKKLFVHTLELAPHTFTASEFDKDFIYLMDRTHQRTMILDRHTYTPLNITGYPCMQNREHKNLAYGDTIVEAVINELSQLGQVEMKEIDYNVYIRDPLTGEVKWVLDKHNKKVIDIKISSEHDSFYTFDEDGELIKWQLRLRCWKAVLYQKMIGTANTIEDLNKLHKRLQETYFLGTLHGQELAEVEKVKKNNIKKLRDGKFGNS